MKQKSIHDLIKKHARTNEEKEELWKIVDEIIHHRVVGCVLDNLESKHHQEFLEKLNASSFDTEIISFLENKTDEKVIEKIQEEIQKIESEILEELL